MKNTILIGLSLLVFGGTGFAAESGKTSFNQARYNELQKAFNAGAINWRDFDFQSNDQAIIAAHKQIKEDELKTSEKLWAPLLWRMSGYAAAIPAVVGGAYGAINFVNAYNILRYHHNIDTYFPWYKSMSYSELFQHSLMHDVPVSLGLKSQDDYNTKERTRARSTWNYLEQGTIESGDQTSAVLAGLGAPFVALAALAFAGMSRYFFNSAKGYESEIEELKKDIQRDEAMLEALSLEAN